MTKPLPFAREALAQIPKILTLQDRNAHSPTYGCFDRNFWHYKIIDFPSGMAAEFVWPLALAFSLEIEGNSFHRQPALREWGAAAIRYAAKSAHEDGSCDDYFPYEKAAGAAAFSLLAMMEAYAIFEFDDPAMREFFQLRADWLAGHHESGRLTNHQALIVLCLERAERLLGTKRWTVLKERRLERVLEWQNSEGWFQEYEGCDPGYHTLTIGILAQLHELAPAPNLKAAIEKAVQFAAHFVHPDGSFGGEYTSRNTYNFFPHGFEIAGKWLPEALEINDRFMAGLERGLGPCYADDHIIGHHTWSYLLAWRDFVPERPALRPRVRGRQYFRNAGIVIDRRDDTELFLALNKGGVFKLFRGGKLVCSDTQFSARARDGGKTRTAVAHLVGDYEIHFTQDSIGVSGDLGWAKGKQMTPFNLLALRLLMLSVGRFFPDLVRQLLQKLLITGKKKAPLQFVRRIDWSGGQIKVSDELTTPAWSKVESVGIGAAQTSIYVVMSRTFQAGQMQPWIDLTDKIHTVRDGEALKLERVF
ncbi:MAG TPA: hypothetical protein VGH90_13520 [Chthoniobacteraceae bacterium]|jgi:hypothetical protein